MLVADFRVVAGVVDVQLLSCVRLFVTPWTAACQAGFPVPHCLLEFAHTHIRQIGDAIQPSHPLSRPSSAVNLCQPSGLYSSHQVAKVSGW